MLATVVALHNAERAFSYRPALGKEDEVRQWHCECGTRMVADDNEQLIEEALIHTYEVHPEMDLTEEQVRQMVAEQASDTEDASSY